MIKNKEKRIRMATAEKTIRQRIDTKMTDEQWFDYKYELCKNWSQGKYGDLTIFYIRSKSFWQFVLYMWYVHDLEIISILESWPADTVIRLSHYRELQQNRFESVRLNKILIKQIESDYEHHRTSKPQS